MKYLLFGTGDYYRRLKKWFKRDDILALIDNNKNIQGTEIDGIPVMSPKEGITHPYDAIIVLSVYIEEMKKQLTDLGVQESKIYHFYELHKFLSYERDKREITIFGDKAKNKPQNRSALLLTQDLALGGPAIALYHMGVALRQFGYDVTFASMEDGPLREKLMADGFTVVIDENLQIFTMNECGWTQNYDLVVANTINFYYFLSNRNISTKIIWWLHDSEFFYHGVEKDILKNIDLTNITMASVGTVPQKAFMKYRPDAFFNNLCYGVKDAGFNCGENRDGLIRFITIGFVEWRKGQDILVEAIKKLPYDILDKCSFTFVGADTSTMAATLKSETENMENVTFTGKVSRDRINVLLSAADILICPSREDPMPTVAAEAMMHGVPCLLSDSTGTAEYIDDKMNGILFHSENIEDLRSQIRWCVNNIDRVNEMRPNARKVYKMYFTEDVLKKDLKQLIDKIL